MIYSILLWLNIKENEKWLKLFKETKDQSMSLKLSKELSNASNLNETVINL